MIPITLVISLEIVKFVQAFYMANDRQMYSKFRNRTFKVSNSALSEDLGQIQHIFTDKTGTLTSNRMEFKYYTFSNHIFGDIGALMDAGYSSRPTHTDKLPLCVRKQRDQGGA
jgi:P-type E1-E2 ATPase